MKSLFVLSALFLGNLSAFASTANMVTLSNLGDKIAQVSVDTTGMMQISLRGQTQPVYKQLTHENTLKVEGFATRLSSAELQTDHRKIMCQSIVLAQYLTELSVGVTDSETGDFQTGAMKVVLTPNFCSIYSYTHPKAQAAMTDATVIVNLLEALAYEAI